MNLEQLQESFYQSHLVGVEFANPDDLNEMIICEGEAVAEINSEAYAFGDSYVGSYSRKQAAHAAAKSYDSIIASYNEQEARFCR